MKKTIRKIIAVYSAILIVNSQMKYELLATMDEKAQDNCMYVDNNGHMQIKENRLDELTTQELLDIVMDYPDNSKFYFCNYFKDVIDNYESYFNGVSELLNRDDFLDTIVADYLEINIPSECFAEYRVERNGEYLDIRCDDDNLAKQDFNIIFRVFFEENYLSQSEIYNSLSSVDRIKILKKVYGLESEKGKSDLFYNTKQSIFFDNTINDSHNNWSEITNFFLSDNEEESVGACLHNLRQEYQSLYIFTPLGSPVLCKKYYSNPQLSDTEVYLYHVQNPDALIVSRGYKNNNCHAYAWAGREDIIMNNPDKYWLDGSYVQTNNMYYNYRVKYDFGHSAYISNTNYIYTDPETRDTYPVRLMRSTICSQPVVDWPESHMTEYGDATYYRRVYC